jgi:hypothetical protein
MTATINSAAARGQAREPAGANFVHSEAPAIANFSESRNDNRVKRGSFRPTREDRLSSSVSRAHFEHDLPEIVRLTD